MMRFYLVGVCWFSADQGDFPNTSQFPKKCFGSLEEAEALYQELSKKDNSWTGGGQSAYLVEADLATGGFTTLKGRVDP